MCLIIVTATPLLGLEFKGAGASLPKLYFENMFLEYTRIKGHTVNYQPIGSENGIQLLKENQIDFAVSEIPLAQPDRNHIQVPITIGAISISYNLPGNPVIKLTSKLLRDIFTGKIKYWDNPNLKNINPHLTLPHQKISIIYRSKTSGTHFLFSNYLSETRSRFLKLKKKTPISIPKGQLVGSSEEMAKSILNTPGSIGYISYQYAEKHTLSVASIKNKSGYYVLPSLNTVLSASESQSDTDTRSTLINSDNSLAYPICGISWMSFKRNFSTTKPLNEIKLFVNFLWWLTHEGQTYALENNFPPLPKHLMKESTEKLKYITYSGIILY